MSDCYLSPPFLSNEKKMDHSRPLPDCPPPAYTETDLFSNSAYTPQTSHAGDASLPARVTPSRTNSDTGSIIYTPPDTPTGSVHQDSSGNPSLTSFEHQFFESRPAPDRISYPATTHCIRITPYTTPDDLPYPSYLMRKDVNEQDWLTFLNHLLPGHAASVNNSIADRKLRAELVDERMHRLTLNHNDRSRIDLREVDAQLEPLRSSNLSEDRMRDVREVIEVWNEGFFGPRGIKVELTTPVAAQKYETERIPGAWVDEENSNPNPQNEQERGRWGMFGNFSRFGNLDANTTGFRLGSIVADNNGFRIGRKLIADANGFRMGHHVAADRNGVRFGGHRGIVADGNGISIGGRSFGGGGRGGGCHDEGRKGGRGRGGRHEHHHQRGRSRGSHDRHDGHARRGRGGSASSCSSSSSDSHSSSSSDSDESIGSLPSYDHLKDHQLPIAKQSLLAWLNHPDQPITKDSIREMRREISTAFKDRSSPEIPADMKKTTRKEIKELMKQFKEQKKILKAKMREVKMQKKEDKRARRQARKAAKRERKAERKERRGGGRGIGRVPDECQPHQPSLRDLPTNHSPSFPRDPRFLRTPLMQNLSSHASNLHHQHALVSAAAIAKEQEAISTRLQAAEQKKGALLHKALRLEEEADELRREEKRLKGEAEAADEEFAKGLGDEDRDGVRFWDDGRDIGRFGDRGGNGKGRGGPRRMGSGTGMRGEDEQVSGVVGG